MVRALLLLTGASVLLNALTFLTVAHYVSTRESAPAAAASRSSPGESAGAPAEVLGRLKTLESSLTSLGKKIDGLASRPALTASQAGRTSRGRPPTGRRPFETPAGVADAEEGDAGDAETAAAPPPKASAAKPAPPPAPGPAPAPAPPAGGQGDGARPAGEKAEPGGAPGAGGAGEGAPAGEPGAGEHGGAA